MVVEENYLEIHLFWNGKGTTGIPTQATYGPIISAISAVSGKQVIIILYISIYVGE